MTQSSAKNKGNITFLSKTARDRTLGDLPESVSSRKREPLSLPVEVRDVFESLKAGQYVEIGTTSSQGTAVGSITSWRRAAVTEGFGADFISAIRKDGDVIALWIGRDKKAVAALNERLATKKANKAKKEAEASKTQ